MTNGYDATMADMYLAMAISAARRGFHCLLYDGPGQGGMLVEQGVPLRADWEQVLGGGARRGRRLAPTSTDPSIASQGWSLGGHLVLRVGRRRAATRRRHRRPSRRSLPVARGRRVSPSGLDEAAVRRLPDLSDDDAAAMMHVVSASRELEWGLVKRGFWVNGTVTIQEFVRSTARRSRSPVSWTPCAAQPCSRRAEGDPLSQAASALAQQIASPSR